MSGTEAKSPRWKSLGPRFFTALAVLFICIAPLYFGGLAWALLVAVFASRILYEWFRMTDPDAPFYVLLVGIAGLLVALAYAVQGLVSASVIAFSLFTLALVAERLRRGKANWTAFGIPYVVLPAILLVILRGAEAGFDTRGFTQLVFVIVVVIAADVGAYFGGSSIGGPKLAPKLSPNKTWSGALTGLVFAVFVGVVAGLFIGLPPMLAAGLSVPIVVLSVLGDLLESLVKRRIGVKDTGSLLPGHGGLLDRLDSLMAAIVGAAFLFMAIGDSWPIL